MSFWGSGGPGGFAYWGAYLHKVAQFSSRLQKSLLIRAIALRHLHVRDWWAAYRKTKAAIQNELHQQQECLSHKKQHHRRVNGDLRSHELRLQYYTTNENTDASRLRNPATDPTT